MSAGRSIGWLVGLWKFLKRREVTLPCSYQNTFLLDMTHRTHTVLKLENTWNSSWDCDSLFSRKYHQSTTNFSISNSICMGSLRPFISSQCYECVLMFTVYHSDENAVPIISTNLDFLPSLPQLEGASPLHSWEVVWPAGKFVRIRA